MECDGVAMAKFAVITAGCTLRTEVRLGFEEAIMLTNQETTNQKPSDFIFTDPFCLILYQHL